MLGCTWIPAPGCRKVVGRVRPGADRLGIDLADGWDGLVEVAAKLRDAAVELEREGDAVSMRRENGAGPGDGFGEAEGRLASRRRVGAEAIKVEEIERSGLRIKVKYRRNFGGRCWLLACRRAHDDADNLLGLPVSGEIGTGAPGAVGAGDSVRVGSESPFVLEVLVLHKSEAGRETILRREAAERDVQRLAQHQGLADVAQVSESEGGTGLRKLLPAGMKLQPLTAEIGLDAAFVTGLVTNLIAGLRPRHVRDEDHGQQCERAPLHLVLGVVRAFFGAAFLEAVFFGGAGMVAAVATRGTPGIAVGGSFAGLSAETAASSAG